jgi:DNA-binding XRE family transcriptional regulator
MTTLTEIENAAGQLPPAERQQLLLSIARSLRLEGHLPPLPVELLQDDMACTDEDVAAMRQSIVQLERGEGQPADEVFRELRAELLAMKHAAQGGIAK